MFFRMRASPPYYGSCGVHQVLLLHSEIALEICRREGIKAAVVGSIVPLGSHYAITLEALDSRQSDTLARIQVEAESKEGVLHALSRAAAGLREKLGESLRSIQKFDALLERTTGSIEALRAYSLGHEIEREAISSQPIPFFQNAVELDPDFAYGWARPCNLLSQHQTARPCRGVFCQSLQLAGSR